MAGLIKPIVYNITILRLQVLADAKKEEGNGFYKEHKYSEALACYTEAISKTFYKFLNDML